MFADDQFHETETAALLLISNPAPAHRNQPVPSNTNIITPSPSKDTTTTTTSDRNTPRPTNQQGDGEPSTPALRRLTPRHIPPPPRCVVTLIPNPFQAPYLVDTIHCSLGTDSAIFSSYAFICLPAALALTFSSFQGTSLGGRGITTSRQTRTPNPSNTWSTGRWTFPSRTLLFLVSSIALSLSR